MRIAVLKERRAGRARVAATPDSIATEAAARALAAAANAVDGGVFPRWLGRARRMPVLCKKKER